MNLEEVIVSMIYVAALNASKQRVLRRDSARGRALEAPRFNLLRCISSLREQLAAHDLLT